MRFRIGQQYYHTTDRFKKIILSVVALTSVLTFYNIAPSKATAEPIQNFNFKIPLEFDAYQKYIDSKPKIAPVIIKKKEFKALNHQEINNLDLRQLSNLNDIQAEDIVKDTGLKGLGSSFVKAEELYGINALYLISHAAWESAWGNSRLAKVKNNLFGFTAYDDTPGTSATTFSTKEECILFVAKFIKEQYLSEGGLYYNGPTLKGMNIKYASDQKWASSITEVIECLQGKVA